MDDEHQEAVNFLNDFFIKMNAWGVRVINLYANDPGGPQGNQEKMRSELKQIFEKYLTVKDRKSGRAEVMAVSLGQPDYDPKTEEILKAEYIKAWLVIFTRKNYPNNYYEELRYKLKKTGDGFRIDSKERFSSGKNAWVKDII